LKLKMKLIGKNRDREIDTLLRASVGRPPGKSAVCPEFDPDLANAYVEHRLPTGLLARYETHLSGCTACRKSVVTLSRLAAPPSGEARPGRVRVRGVLSGLSRPQWALAAAAVIALVISLPLLLSRNHNQLDERVSPAVAEPGANSAASTAPVATGDASHEDLLATAKPREERILKNAARSRKAQTQATTDSNEEKLEARSDNQPTDELKQKSETQSASQVAAAAAPESQAPKSDSDKGRHQQQKDSAQGGESKDRADDVAAKEKAKLAEVAPAPPPAPTRARTSRQPAGKMALRDNTASDSVRPAERQIRSKKFLWKDGTWTDKDFDPDKGLPVVTIIRDSNVYNEVITKHAGLKPYLTAFESERAIIVYKGTVYKLIPQQN
jgi:hypothetical protein